MVPSQKEDVRIPEEGNEHVTNILVKDTMYVPTTQGVNVYETRSGKSFFRGGLPTSISAVKINSPSHDRLLFYDTLHYYLYMYNAGDAGFSNLGKFVFNSNQIYTHVSMALRCVLDRTGVLFYAGLNESVYYGSLQTPPYTIHQVAGDFCQALVLAQNPLIPQKIISRISQTILVPWVRSPSGAMYIIGHDHKMQQIIPAPYALNKTALKNTWQVMYKGEDVMCSDKFEDNFMLWMIDNESRELFMIDTAGHITMGKKKIEAGISVYDMIAAGADKLWVIHDLNGLHQYSLSNGHIKSFEDDSKTPLPTKALYRIERDDFNKDILWVKTQDMGLLRINEKLKTVSTYTQKDGLADNTIFCLLKDGDGILWYSTKQGIYRFDTKLNIHKRIYTSGELPNENFAQGFAHYMNDGKFYFGTTTYFIAFDPAAVHDETRDPPLVLSGLKINNKPIEENDAFSNLGLVNNLKQFNLAYNQNFISFEFAALDYNRPEKTVYRYKLDGIDKDWVLNGTENTAQYTSLPSGHYVFNVNATNVDGNWEKEIKTIIVDIAPPWWRTWWMYGLYFLIVGSAVYWVFDTRLKRLQLKQQVLLKQKEAEQAKAMEDMKSRFFSNITHELRTPLTLIISPVQKQLMQDGAGYSQGLLQGVYKNAEHLLRLINQLLDVGKLETGNLPVTLSRGDLVMFIERLLDTFKTDAAAKNIQLLYQHKGLDIEFVFDSDKLEKIINNLVGNALKFTSDGGKITVTMVGNEVTEGRQQLLIKVADTGIGITAVHLPFIFDRFYQGDNTATRKYEGTGIGLSLVKELATLLGGNITAESIVGEGSVFTLQLPLVVATESIELPKLVYNQAEEISITIPETKLGVLPQKQGAAKPLVLVVEDNVQLRQFIQSSFTERYRIITAANGAEGLQTAVNELPDLIISDVMMPIMDGFEFCCKIKEDPLTSHIGFIMLTAKTADESRMDALRLGADHYLGKPFIVEELLMVAGNLLTRQNKLRAFYQKQLQPYEVAPIANEVEDAFLRGVYLCIEDNIDSTALDVDFLAAKLNVTRRTLNRKLSAIIGMSAIEIIKDYRLKKAAELLLKGYAVTEVAYTTGFTTPSWFTQCFKEMYGVAPSKFLENKGMSQN